MELLSKAPILSCGGKRGGEGEGSPMGPLVGALGSWIYRAVKAPPSPRICGAPGGPPVTAPRVRLRDGRHLAYAESGVRKEDARYKVVFSHGFTGSRLDTLCASPVSPRFSGVSLQLFATFGFPFFPGKTSLVLAVAGCCENVGLRRHRFFSGWNGEYPLKRL